MGNMNNDNESLENTSGRAQAKVLCNQVVGVGGGDGGGGL